VLKVILLAYTPMPEKVVAAAAKNCYSASDIPKLYDGLSDESAASFVEMLSEIGHESPIEHAVFTFGIEGVSRSLLAQLTRHRIASYSVKSQRYVGEGHFAYVIPPEIENLPEAKKAFEDAMQRDQEAYDSICGLLTEKHRQTLIAQGKDEKTALRDARKMANEDARFVLPNACETKIVMTMNARSLRNFFRQRCCNRAQWEIRILAEEMHRLVTKAAPTLFAGSGPACATGPCPEGKMSCGKAAEIRAKYTKG